MTPGTSPHPPLTPERIESARKLHGGAVDQYLQHLHVGDPLADDLMAHFERMPQGEGFRMLHQAIDHGIQSIDQPPAPLVALFQELDHVPFWVDWDRMRQGSGKVIRTGLLTGLAFAINALPYSYLATANKPLAFTGALMETTAHRYAQTTRFVIETFMPGGLRRDADGFKIAVFVRMMHARVRRKLLQSDDWDRERFGVPLNQSHLAMSVVFFSFFVLKGLRRLGVLFSRQASEGILLTWRYVGYLFGIDPEMVYTSEEEAERLVQIAFSLEYDPDELSRKLCRAMMEAGPSYMRIKHERVGRLFVQLLYPIARHLLGDVLADQLEIPREKRRFICFSFVAMVRLFEWFPWLAPHSVRRYIGVQFWLEASNFDMEHLMGADPKSKSTATEAT